MRLIVICATLVTALQLVACSAGGTDPGPPAERVAPKANPAGTTMTATLARPPSTVEKPATAPCERSARACVSLSAKQAWLLRDGSTEYGPVPIATGKVGEETPTGTFRVAWKDMDRISRQYGLPMPYAVFFAAGGIAFHEGSLTEPSHGCVHLSNEAARTFFEALPVGAVVQVVA